MNPLHKEKYVLSKETFGYVTIDQNKPQLEKNKRNIRLTSWIQIIVGTIFIGAVIVLKQKDMFVFTALAAMLIGVGIFGVKTKGKKYDKQIWENIEKTYNAREYGDNWFEVKFFEDHLKYLVGGNTDELSYTDFNQFFETANYFCLHFITGDLLTFNPDCNKEKIKEIITAYRKKGLEEAEEAKEEESIVEEIIEDIHEEIAEEILEEIND